MICVAVPCRRPQGTQERVLRYPDGHERRIRYPVVTAEEAAAAQQGYAEEWVDPDYWGPDSWDCWDFSWDIPGASLWAGFTGRKGAAHKWTAKRGLSSRGGASPSPPAREQVVDRGVKPAERVRPGQHV